MVHKITSIENVTNKGEIPAPTSPRRTAWDWSPLRWQCPACQATYIVPGLADQMCSQCGYVERG